MDTQKFNDNIVKKRLALVEQIFSRKVEEYARGDRLSNFKVVAKFMGLTPEKVCFVWILKHIEALKSFINDLDEGKLQSPERWTEKIGDTINYMILLEALIVERQEDCEPIPDESTQ